MRDIWNRWKKLAEKIGRVQAVIIFSTLYFILITPIGFLTARVFDYLNLRKLPRWIDFEAGKDSVAELRKQ